MSSFAEPGQKPSPSLPVLGFLHPPTLLPPLTQVSTPAKSSEPLEVWDKAQPQEEPSRERLRRRGTKAVRRTVDREMKRRRMERQGKGEGSTDPVCGRHTRCRYLAGRWSHCLKGEKIIPGVYGSTPSPPPHSQVWAHTYVHAHVHTHIGVCTSLYTHELLHACACMPKCPQAYMLASMCALARARIHTSVCMCSSLCTQPRQACKHKCT